MTETMENFYKAERDLRHNPIVEAWIKAYQKVAGAHNDCRNCGYPHSPILMCGRGATFGQIEIGRHAYTVDDSNVAFFYKFMSELGQDLGFHWRDETFFKRFDDGSVRIRYIEQYNNHPQIREWVIPPNEWASIVCSVSRDGETGERWNAAQDFHGRTEANSPSGPPRPSGPPTHTMVA